MKWLGKIFIVLLLSGMSALFYSWHYEQKITQLLLHTIKKEIECARSLLSQSKSVVDHSVSAWGEVQSKSYNSVVQILVHRAEFNWLEPYKTPHQSGGAGTGFFIERSGLIITNAHVIDQSRVIYIQIPHFGKRRFDVTVVGVSPERDLALLQVDSNDLAIIIKELGDLPILTFGDSDQVFRADEIMALGYPLGQDSLKSTVGVVSGRQHIDGRSMIQIDAAINPGNSGGPSLNFCGKVVGVNTSGIFNQGTQNVGYIIPSNEVQLFLKQLHDAPEEAGIKFLRKPFLGVLYNPANETLAEFLGNPKPGGQYVVEVYQGSPLEKAGIKPGDMIYEIDGHAIDYFGEIRVQWSEDKVSVVDYVSRLMPGDSIHFVVYRNGVRKEFVVTFDYSKVTGVRARFPGYESIDYEMIGGMVLMELSLNHIPCLIKYNAQLTKFFDLESQVEPVVIIAHILADSEASRCRVLYPGMIIKALNGHKVKTLSDLREYVTESIDSGFLTIETVSKVFTVLPFARIVADELRLSQSYFYQISPYMKNIMQHYRQ